MIPYFYCVGAPDLLNLIYVFIFLKENLRLIQVNIPEVMKSK